MLNAVDKDTYTYPIDGWYWFDTDTDAQVLLSPMDAKKQLEYRLQQFAAQKDIDIQEIAILLTSNNPEWVAQAKRLSELYNASWQALYEGSALPELVW